MTGFALSFEDLYNAVGRQLGWEFPTDRQLTIVKDIVYRGLRKFYYPVDPTTGRSHIWSFLKKYHSFSTIADSWKYALPTDFSEILTKPSFGDNTGYSPLSQRSPQQIIEKRTASDSTGYPEYFSITPATFDNEVGTFYEFWIYPAADGVHQLQFFYKIDPLKPENTGDVFPGGVKSMEAILENCLAISEQQEDGVVGLHTQIANELTQKLIITDKQPTTDKLGNLHSAAGFWPKEWRSLTLLDENIYENER